MDESSAKDGLFYSPTKGILGLEEVILEISRFIDQDPEAFYSLVIGTDSQERKSNGTQEIDFITAIVIHRKGFGGRYFWCKEKQKKHFLLRDKIYTETILSLRLAEKLVPEIRGIWPKSCDLEIHIDVGEVGPTRDMIKEVVGMVTGSGFLVKTKPDSWGAFVVADRHT